MLSKNDFPVLEFDDNPTAKLNPINLAYGKFETNKMIITFFPEVVNRLVTNGQITKERSIPCENPLMIYRFTEQPDVLLTLGQVGSCLCGESGFISCNGHYESHVLRRRRRP